MIGTCDVNSQPHAYNEDCRDWKCSHVNTVSVSNGLSDTRKCLDCGQTMSGRELTAARAPKQSRWAILGNAIGEALFGGNR